MFLSLWNYLRGYVIIEVSGFSVERFVNLAVHKGVYIWDVVPNKNGVTMKVSLKGFKLLKNCARKTKCRIKIIEKEGYPFFAFKHRKRYIFVVGLLSFVILLYSLSSFIWLIEIEGNKRIDSDKILSFCESKGFKVGSFKGKIDTKQLEKDLKNNFMDLSWITIQIEGTRATIKLTETIPKLELVDLSTPCDIVAKSDGLVVSIVTRTGTPKVKAKDVVEQGDVLVSGELIVKEDETGILKDYVHSQAEVKAKLFHEINISVPFEYTEKLYTGNEKNYYDVILFNKNFDLNLLKKDVTFENYDKIVSRTQLKASENFALPIIIVKTCYKEYNPIKKNYSYDEAKSLADKMVSRKIIEKFDIETDIIDKAFEYKKTDNALEVKAVITVIENIGIEKPISADNNLINDKVEGSTNGNGTTKDTSTE